MMKKIFIPILTVMVVGVLVVAGWFAYHNVFAAAPIRHAAGVNLPGNILPMNYQWGGQNGSSDQGLADALGVPLATLQASEKTATADALKQAVTAGLVTQAQADQFTSSGKVFRQSGESSWLSANGIDYNALLAKALNIDVSKLTAAYQTAYNTAIDAAVKAGNLTQQQADLLKGCFALSNSSNFQSAMQAAFTAAVNQAVKDGLITQAQADQILKSNTNGGLGPFGGFGMHGGLGPFSGFGGGMRGGRSGGFPFGKGNQKRQATPTPTPSGGL